MNLVFLFPGSTCLQWCSLGPAHCGSAEVHAQFLAVLCFARYAVLGLVVGTLVVQQCSLFPHIGDFRDLGGTGRSRTSMPTSRPQKIFLKIVRAIWSHALVMWKFPTAVRYSDLCSQRIRLKRGSSPYAQKWISCFHESAFQ